VIACASARRWAWTNTAWHQAGGRFSPLAPLLQRYSRQGCLTLDSGRVSGLASGGGESSATVDPIKLPQCPCLAVAGAPPSPPLPPSLLLDVAR